MVALRLGTARSSVPPHTQAEACPPGPADGCVRPRQLYRAATRCMGWRPTRQCQDGGQGESSETQVPGDKPSQESKWTAASWRQHSPSPAHSRDHEDFDLLYLKGGINIERWRFQSVETAHCPVLLWRMIQGSWHGAE